MKIKYERNGIIKLADERFKDDLLAVGWKVVIDDKPKRTRQSKASDDNRKDDN